MIASIDRRRAGAALLRPDHAGRREHRARVLDSSDVTQRWLAGWHVDWRTGEKDRGNARRAGGKDALQRLRAAIAERLGAYVLRPPEHRQELLANAQMRWLREHGSEQGWRTLASDIGGSGGGQSRRTRAGGVREPQPAQARPHSHRPPEPEDARRTGSRWPAGDAGRCAERDQHHHGSGLSATSGRLGTWTAAANFVTIPMR